MVSPIIRISPNKNDSDHDLLRLIFIDERLRKSNGKYYKKSQCYKRLSDIRNTQEFKNITNQVPPTIEDVDNLAQANSKQIIFWNMPNHGQIPELLYESPHDDNFTVINVVAPFLNEPNDYLLVELHLIVDIDEFQRKLRKHKEGNIFECLSWSKLVGDQNWEYFVSIFGSPNVDLSDEHKFIKRLGVGFEIFMSFHQRGKKTDYKVIHRTRLENQDLFISLEFIGKNWEDEKSLINLTDKFILRPKNYFKSFPCPTIDCNYYANSSFNLKRHLKNCSQETKIEYKQKRLDEPTIRDYCVSKGYIPEHYHQRNFCAFDIESIGQELPNEINAERSSNIVNLQRVVSVSVTKSFGDQNTKVLVRQSMSEDDYHGFIRQFMTYLLEISEEFTKLIPFSIKNSITKLDDALQAFRNKERTYSNNQIKQMNEAKQYLTKICRLRCYGYNSAKYDLPCLFPGLLSYADKYNVKVSVLKRGNAILSLTIQNIVFADVCNFTSGCSLDSFTKMWGAETTKAIFPYEKFNSIDGLKNNSDWPPMIDFKSSLGKGKFSYNETEIHLVAAKIKAAISLSDIELVKKLDPTGSSQTLSDLANHDFPVNLDIYTDMWIFFDKQVRNGHMESMLDYLKYYNSLDTISLVQAFSKYIDSFLQNFNCNPNNFVTLPGLAEKVMWSKFSSSKYSPYTFGNKFGHLNKLIRENLMGGLSCVFARHIEVGSSADKFDSNVTTAANGQKFQRIVAMDANSKLYFASIVK